MGRGGAGGRRWGRPLRGLGAAAARAALRPWALPGALLRLAGQALARRWVLALAALHVGSVVAGRRAAALERRRRREEVLQQLEKGDLTSLMGDLPSWITFPDVERSCWLNLALEKLWPHIDAATCSILRNVVEYHLQRAIRGKGGVHSVVFNNLSLGLKPPFIGGVRSFKHQGDSVICDVELRWVAAAVAELGVQLLGGGASLPVRADSLTARGVFRLTLGPLVGQFPLFEAIDVQLTLPLDMDFALKVAGNDLTAWSGVEGVLSKAIRQAVNSIFLFPNKLHINIMKATRAERQNVRGTLLVRLHTLHGLGEEDALRVLETAREQGLSSSSSRRGLQDRLLGKAAFRSPNMLRAFVSRRRRWWSPAGAARGKGAGAGGARPARRGPGAGSRKFEAVRVRVALSLQGDKQSEFLSGAAVYAKGSAITLAQEDGRALIKTFAVRDNANLVLEVLAHSAEYEGHSRQKMLLCSTVQLPLAAVGWHLRRSMRVSLDDGKGEVELDMSFFPTERLCGGLIEKSGAGGDGGGGPGAAPAPSATELSPGRTPSAVMKPAVLVVQLRRAEGLRAADWGGTSDPYCILRVGSQTFQTKCINNTCDPVWDQTASFALNVDGLETATRLEINIWDRDVLSTDDALGRVTVLLRDIPQDGEHPQTRFPVEVVTPGDCGTVVAFISLHVVRANTGGNLRIRDVPGGLVALGPAAVQGVSEAVKLDSGSLLSRRVGADGAGRVPPLAAAAAALALALALFGGLRLGPALAGALAALALVTLAGLVALAAALRRRPPRPSPRGSLPPGAPQRRRAGPRPPGRQDS